MMVIRPQVIDVAPQKSAANPDENQASNDDGSFIHPVHMNEWKRLKKLLSTSI